MEGARYRVTEGGRTLGSGHTAQYTDPVSQTQTLETYMILLSNVTSINVVLKNLKRNKGRGRSFS